MYLCGIGTFYIGTLVQRYGVYDFRSSSDNVTKNISSGSLFLSVSNLIQVATLEIAKKCFFL